MTLAPIPGVKRAVLYVRVSDDSQLEGFSIPAQIKALTEFAQKNGWIVVGQYIEEGESARSDKRPEFQRMISDAKRQPRPFDIILVHKFDRFARSLEDSATYKSLLRKKLGIDVISMSEPTDDSPVGQLIEGVLAVTAQFYSDNLSTEVVKGQRERASQGRSNSIPPIGYKRCYEKDSPYYDKFVPDPDTAPIVRFIFEQYTSGAMGMKEIAKTLSLEGVARFGKAAANYSWTVAFIRRILTNPVYIGTIIYGKYDSQRKRYRPENEWIVVENAHEPLVSREMFERANEIRLSRGRANVPTQSKDWLLRRMVFCMDCGSPMIHFRYQWDVNGQRVVLPCVICTGYTRYSKCYCNRVPIKDIEEAVFAYLRDIAAGTIDMTRVEVKQKRQTDKANQLALLRKQREIHLHRLERARAAYQAGVDSLEEYAQTKRDVEKTLAAIHAQIAELEKQKTAEPAITEQVRQSFREALAIATDESLPIAKRRAALQDVVHSIHVSRKTGEINICIWI